MAELRPSAPNPDLIPGGGFFDALVKAYVNADETNRAALRHGFPTLAELVRQRYGWGQLQ